MRIYNHSQFCMFSITLGWNNSMDNEPFSKVLLYGFTWENAMFFCSREMTDLQMFTCLFAKGNCLTINNCEISMWMVFWEKQLYGQW